MLRVFTHKVTAWTDRKPHEAQPRPPLKPRKQRGIVSVAAAYILPSQRWVHMLVISPTGLTHRITGTMQAVAVGRGCGFVEELMTLQQNGTDALAATAEAFAFVYGAYTWRLLCGRSLTSGEEVRGQADRRGRATGQRCAG